MSVLVNERIERPTPADGEVIAGGVQALEPEIRTEIPRRRWRTRTGILRGRGTTQKRRDQTGQQR